MNEEEHWNNIADNYNGEIFDVFASDKKKLLPHYLKKFKNKSATALDFGCGNGKGFHLLAPNFKNVYAADISEELIKQAQDRLFHNISFLHQDLSENKLRLPKVDFVFSCNVIMLPEIEKNYTMIQNIERSLSSGGNALIVVPSSESILFAGWRMIDWHRKDGAEPEEIDSSDLSYFKGPKTDILQGVFYIDGVATKHYSQSELEVIFPRAGLEITALEKLEYDWNTEFSSPPNWMRDPYPWDWLITLKKN